MGFYQDCRRLRLRLYLCLWLLWQAADTREQRFLLRMRQPFNGGGHLQPQGLANLFVVLGARFLDERHFPEKDDFGHAVIGIADGAQVVSNPAGAARFFLHLAHRRFLERFAIFHFAAGKGPILVAFAVNHHHFIAARGTALQNTAGGFDDRRDLPERFGAIDVAIVEEF